MICEGNIALFPKYTNLVSNKLEQMSILVRSISPVHGGARQNRCGNWIPTNGGCVREWMMKEVSVERDSVWCILSPHSPKESRRSALLNDPNPQNLQLPECRLLAWRFCSITKLRGVLRMVAHRWQKENKIHAQSQSPFSQTYLDISINVLKNIY